MRDFFAIVYYKFYVTSCSNLRDISSSVYGASNKEVYQRNFSLLKLTKFTCWAGGASYSRVYLWYVFLHIIYNTVSVLSFLEISQWIILGTMQKELFYYFMLFKSCPLAVNFSLQFRMLSLMIGWMLGAISTSCNVSRIQHYGTMSYV